MNINTVQNIPIWNVFVLFLIIASNYIGELFPCRIQDLLSRNVYLKHFIAFLTLLFFVVLTDSTREQKRFKEIFNNSIILYVLFLLLINCNRKFFIVVLFLLVLSYIIRLIKNDYINNHEIDEEVKDHFKYVNYLEFTIYVLFFITLILGFIIYMGEKKLEYKNKFSYITFIFGKPTCKGKSPKTNYIEAFISAFK